MASESIKTASQVITEFLDALSKDATLDTDTVVTVSNLRNDGDLSKIKLLRKLEEVRKAELKADGISEGEVGDD